MKITYDLEHLPERKRYSKESEETTALKTFLAGKQRNMCIEYDDERSAKRRYDTLRNFRRTNKLQERFNIYRVEKSVYIVKTKKPAAKA